jgi:polar amino acid transport system substrate-binding protein
MRKTLRRVLAVFAAAALLVTGGCSGTKSITIGISADSAPLSSKNSQNEPEGFIVEMAREAGKRMGMEINLKYVNMSDEAKNFTAQGVDALWGQIAPDSKNEENMLFTKPYLSDGQVIVVESASKIERKDDLKDKTIGAVTGSRAETALLKSGLVPQSKNGSPQAFKELVSAFISLNGSKTDALAVDKTYAHYLMTEHAEQYRILEGDLASEQYAVAVRRNDSNLRDAFQSALDAMKTDGTTENISKKWFGINMT